MIFAESGFPKFWFKLYFVDLYLRKKWMKYVRAATKGNLIRFFSGSNKLNLTELSMCF
jgi:hypothetical protein